MDELLLAKIMPPQRGGMLDRPRIADRIAGTDGCKVAFLTAPAGYGKTVAMLQAAKAMDRKLAWCQLDVYDNDPVVFLRYLAASLEQALAGFGAQVLPLLGGGAAGRQRLFVTAFVRELSRHEMVPLLVALDDYHVIINSFVHQFVEDLLLHLPEHIQVMIAGRTLPPFNAYRLRDTAGLLTVGAEQLRFTDEEVQAFLPVRGPGCLSPEREALVRRLNGWPVAVTFAANMYKEGSELSLLAGEEADLHGYLAEEVLARQPAELVDFMQTISVLDVITAEACDRLLERDDSHRLLKVLHKRELLLSRLECPEEAYRYHQLLREFLLERLGEERPLWQCKAGKLALQSGELNAAVEYFRAAGDMEILCDTVREAGLRALGQGLWHTVSRWLDSLDRQRLKSDPWLRYLRATVEVYKGCLEEAEEWLDGLETSFAAQGNQGGLTESRLLQARIWRCRGLFSQSLELLEQVVDQIPPEQRAQRFDLPLEKSLILLVLGRLQEAEAVLLEAFASARSSGNNYLMAHLLEGLGNIYYMQGEYPKALHQYQQGASLLPERVLPGYYAQDSIASIYQDWGELEKALEYAKRNIAIKENLGLAEALPSAYLQLAGLHTDRQEWQLAEQCHEKANRLLQEHNGEHFFRALNLVFWGLSLDLQGRLSEARLKTEAALAIAEPQAGLALAVCRAVGATVFVQTGSMAKGKEMLAAAIEALTEIGFNKGLAHACAFQSWLCSVEGEAAEAEAYAQRALALAARIQCQQLFLTHYEMLQPVLEIGLTSGTEITFVQRILVRKGEQALSLLARLAGHNDPEVRLRVIAPLAEIRGDQAIALITGLTGDAAAAVSQPARLAARRLGIPAVPGASYAELPAVLLQVNMLGGFKVLLQGVELGKTGWRTAKTQDLLAYLIHKGEPVDRERIQEDLWPDMDAENAANIFHVTLHRLRKLLSKAGCPDILCYSGKRYSLRPDSVCRDTQQFEELAATGLRKETSPEEREACLEQAVALYRGDYLAALDYCWLLHSREKLKRLYAEIRMSLARHYLELRSYGQAITHLQIVAEEDPFAEETHALLMKAYAGQGSRTAAIRQYQKAEAILQKELGLRPSTHLHDLYRSLMQ